MKLLNRTSRYYFLFSLLVFAIIGLALFFGLRYTLDGSTDESLKQTRPALARELLQLKALEPTMYIMDEVIELRPIAALSDRESYRDTVIELTEANGELETEPYRKYSYDALIGEQPYRISISLSTVENEDLIRTLLLVVLSGLLLFLLAINVLNRYLAQRLWQPFYKTLSQIKSFSIQQNTAPAFAPSDTTEFDDLNRSLETMTGQLINEYESLRRFTENASHELQTPLAIIRHQIDLFLREGERSEGDYAIIQQLSEAVSKLGKLNQSLLLLTKIERGQVPEAEVVALMPLLERKLEQLAQALEEKRIELTTEITPQTVRLPMMLADVLLNNLLGNAIRHNLAGGELAVRLAGGELIIENTGPPLQQAPELLFERFSKESKTADSLGLGLAIVREICDKYGYTLRYSFAAGRHRVAVGL